MIFRDGLNRKRRLFEQRAITPESCPQVLKYLTWTLLASLALFQLVPCCKICLYQESAHFFPATIKVLDYKCLRTKTCFTLLVKHHSCLWYSTSKIIALRICFSVEAVSPKNREAWHKLALPVKESYPMACWTSLVWLSGTLLSPSTVCFVVSQIRIILWGEMKPRVSTALLCGCILTRAKLAEGVSLLVCAYLVHVLCWNHALVLVTTWKVEGRACCTGLTLWGAGKVSELSLLFLPALLPRNVSLWAFASSRAWAQPTLRGSALRWRMESCKLRGAESCAEALSYEGL